MTDNTSNTRSKLVDGGNGDIPEICGLCVHLKRGLRDPYCREYPQCYLGVFMPFKTGKCKRFRSKEATHD